MSPTWITTSEIDQELDRLGKANLEAVVKMCGREQWSYPALLLAIASRETNIFNEVGDGGHGRGAWQIDDRTWGSWLASVPGVRTGTWEPVVAKSAIGGLCPTLKDGLRKAIEILAETWQFAADNRVSLGSRAAVMVAGYNCGPGNALQGWRQGNPDDFTTGRNYSTDVFQRETVVHDYLKAHKLVK